MTMKKSIKQLMAAMEAWREGEPKSLVITLNLMLKLYLGGQVSVQDFMNEFNMTQPNVVRHMQSLMLKQLAEVEEVLDSGTWKKLYRLTDKGKKRVETLVNGITSDIIT